MDASLQPAVDAVTLAIIEHGHLSPAALAWVVAERVVDTPGAARLLVLAALDRGSYQPLPEPPIVG